MDSELETARATPLPPGSVQRPDPRPNGRLGSFSPQELAFELERRLREEIADHAKTGEAEIASLVHLASALADRIDVYENRFSRARYRQLVSAFITELRPKPPIVGATWVDLGCGAVNPFGFAFLLLLLGATRAFAIDLDEVHDTIGAFHALSDAAALAFVDPNGLFGELAPSREALLANLRGFDLPRLRTGDAAGIASDRLVYRRASVHALPLADGEADVVASCAFLEHIDRIDDALDEIARVTRRGGLGIHVIDGRDHRHYGDASIHPLEFLADPTGAEMVHGSNRIRPLDFVRRFAKHGFVLREILGVERVAVPPELRKRFAPPFRDLPQEELESVLAKLVVERL